MKQYQQLISKKNPVFAELINDIAVGSMPTAIYNKIIQEIHLGIIREYESLKIKDPNVIQVRIFGRDYIIYIRSDKNEIEMIEKQFYEILKCKYII